MVIKDGVQEYVRDALLLYSPHLESLSLFPYLSPRSFVEYCQPCIRRHAWACALIVRVSVSLRVREHEVMQTLNRQRTPASRRE